MGKEGAGAPLWHLQLQIWRGERENAEGVRIANMCMQGRDELQYFMRELGRAPALPLFSLSTLGCL